jgi:glutathione peroxidase
MNSKIIVFALMTALIIFSMSSFIDKRTKILYDFKAKTIEGRDFDFSSLKGKKVMIVNTASLCGFTPQYADLEKLYTMYKDSGFTIIGFPANNFGSQEPGSNTEIKALCSSKYNVTFRMMEKISVEGDDIHPLYKWLTEKSENGVQDAPVKWNFQKFLIDENGNWAGVAMSKESPLSERIISWIRGKK